MAPPRAQPSAAERPQRFRAKALSMLRLVQGRARLRAASKRPRPNNPGPGPARKAPPYARVPHARLRLCDVPLRLQQLVAGAAGGAAELGVPHLRAAAAAARGCRGALSRGWSQHVGAAARERCRRGTRGEPRKQATHGSSARRPSRARVPREHSRRPGRTRARPAHTFLLSRSCFAACIALSALPLSLHTLMAARTKRTACRFGNQAP